MRGIDPDIAIRVLKSEGGIDEYAKRGTFATGSSWWPTQLHFGGVGTPYEYLGTVAGMGNGFTKLTGWQPGSDAAWRDAIRYGFNRAKASSWAQWYGAAHVGVGAWEGIDRDFPFDANSEVWDYEATAPADLHYDASTPPERQIADWTCSIRSTSWCLLSLGVPVDIGALQDFMTPRYVTPQLGLLDGTGAGLAETLRHYLPSSWAERVHVYERIDWTTLWAKAGTGPIALGLHGAYHWINVAAPQSDGHLSSPNPAPKYPQAAPIGDVLTADEFGLYGPASAVWVDAAPLVTEVPPMMTYNVGQGILEEMQRHGDVPGSDEIYMKSGSRDAWSEAQALSGHRYIWLPSAGRVWRYPPS